MAKAQLYPIATVCLPFSVSRLLHLPTYLPSFLYVEQVVIPFSRLMGFGSLWPRETYLMWESSQPVSHSLYQSKSGVRPISKTSSIYYRVTLLLPLERGYSSTVASRNKRFWEKKANNTTTTYFRKYDKLPPVSASCKSKANIGGGSCPCSFLAV